jgi:hypothetical protein
LWSHLKGDNEFSWSKTEKSVTRKAYDIAYEREIADILQDIKRRIESYKNPKDVWALHNYLSNKREEIDYKYDYRYSVLIFVFVFARLMKDGYTTKEDLQIISAAKIQAIVERARIMEEMQNKWTK